VLYYNAYSIISTTILQHFNIESLHSICYSPSKPESLLSSGIIDDYSTTLY
jgi:hypothetical protein